MINPSPELCPLSKAASIAPCSNPFSTPVPLIFHSTSSHPQPPSHPHPQLNPGLNPNSSHFKPSSTPSSTLTLHLPLPVSILCAPPPASQLPAYLHPIFHTNCNLSVYFPATVSMSVFNLKSNYVLSVIKPCSAPNITILAVHGSTGFGLRF